MKPVLVILAVGLSPCMVGKETPNLRKLVARGGLRPLKTVTPAVTCTVQSTLLTGEMPAVHGAVANGWYDRMRAEIGFWKQSNHLIKGEKIWEAAQRLDPQYTCAKMFWWYNMYSTANWSATPRPQYPADGRKIPDHYTWPANLHDELDSKLGSFPLFNFWGPKADIVSSRWISDATLHVMQTRHPSLTLTYLPHLDYNLQRLGPDLSHPRIRKDLQELDELCGELIDAADLRGAQTIVVSEYGITPVTEAIDINRHLRRHNWLAVRVESGMEQLDAGASEAFAVADHQIAHVYVKRPENIDAVCAQLQSIDGIDSVLLGDDRQQIGLDHSRSGDIIAISSANRWFSYYHWLDGQHAPDYCRTVDIHRKPGYDPVELFIDPDIKWPKLKLGRILIAKKLGFARLMDVISPSATQLVKGSHGRPTDNADEGPLVISSNAGVLPNGEVHAVDFKNLVLAHQFDQYRIRMAA